MRLFILAIFLLIIFSGCDSDIQSKKSNLNQQPSHNKVIEVNTEKISELTISKIDTLKLINNFNQFVPTITKPSHAFICKIDTLKLNSLNQIDLSTLFINNASIISYTFDCGDFFKNIRVIEGIYSDSIDSKKVFSELYNKNINESGCLNKTNNYLLRTEKRIFWINGSCHYPYSNFLKIESLIIESLIDVSIKDSIKCKCGGQNMTNK